MAQSTKSNPVNSRPFLAYGHRPESAVSFVGCMGARHETPKRRVSNNNVRSVHSDEGHVL